MEVTIISSNKIYKPALCDELIKKIQQRAPLVHHITNWVTIYDCAQITRSIGALPIMAHMKEEVADMVNLADALVLNIGTLNHDLLDSMLIAGRAANSKSIPIVIDIVGCGATPARTEAVKNLMSHLQFAIIKGNAGEIGAAAGVKAVVKGVESVSVSGDLSEIAKTFSKTADAVVVVTGPTDIVTNGDEIHLCRAGHPLMAKVVGTGCMSTSILAAFASIAENVFDSAVCAINFYGAAGEEAASKASTPMAFKNEFLDSIYHLAHSNV